MTDSTVYTLVRGPKAEGKVPDDKLKGILDNKRTSEKEKIAAIQKSVDTPRSGDFTDQAHSVTFSVTKPIGITALGFFGPHDNNSAEYRLKFNIYAMASMTTKVNRKALASVDRKIEAHKDKIFYVNFDQTVYCPAETWIRIEFMMNGPATSVCGKISPNYKEPGVTFEFSNSSKQIPEIKFKATKPIGVTSLGFYGPYNSASAVYRLKFNIRDEIPESDREPKTHGISGHNR